jgi:hypothetical protein
MRKGNVLYLACAVVCAVEFSTFALLPCVRVPVSRWSRSGPGWGAGVEDEGVVYPLFWRAGGGAEGAGQFGFGVLAGAGLVDADGPVVFGALVAQAQDRGGLGAAGQERGDVAVLAAVASGFACP